MSEARTIWHTIETRRNATAGRERAGLLCVAALLCAMAAAEALFLQYVAGPESADLLAAAEGIHIVE
jgi:hypothetical protein